MKLGFVFIAKISKVIQLRLNSEVWSLSCLIIMLKWHNLSIIKRCFLFSLFVNFPNSLPAPSNKFSTYGYYRHTQHWLRDAKLLENKVFWGCKSIIWLLKFDKNFSINKCWTEVKNNVHVLKIKSSLMWYVNYTYLIFSISNKFPCWR